MKPPTTWAARRAAFRFTNPLGVRALSVLLAVALLVCLPARAFARSAGSATEGCGGCHGGGKTPTVLITPDLATVNPGQVVNLTVSISTANGFSAGFFLESSTGKLSVVDSGTKLSGFGITHSATRSVASGTPNITFKVGWTAPAAPGGVDFAVWANSANGDRANKGDGEGTAFLSLAYGCAGTKYYHDYDGDGVGAVASGYTVSCSVPQYYTEKLGDCNDNDPKVFVGNTEVCDGKDNNCDRLVDEGLPITMYCTDADFDGHGVSGKATMMGCGVSKGFGLCDNDCNDSDATIYPTAVELCNNKDDNCNDRVDENARTVCGVGWCAKYADGCTTSCTPGLPRTEECNDFDDDCDGVNDNGPDPQLCGKAGLTCKEGYCVGSGSGGMSSGSAGSLSSGSGSTGSSAGGTSQPEPGTGGSGNGAVSQAPPAHCGIGFVGSRSPFATAGVLLTLAALLRRGRRRSAR